MIKKHRFKSFLILVLVIIWIYILLPESHESKNITEHSELKMPDSLETWKLEMDFSDPFFIKEVQSFKTIAQKTKKSKPEIIKQENPFLNMKYLGFLRQDQNTSVILMDRGRILELNNKNDSLNIIMANNDSLVFTYRKERVILYSGNKND